MRSGLLHPSGTAATTLTLSGNLVPAVDSIIATIFPVPLDVLLPAWGGGLDSNQRPALGRATPGRVRSPACGRRASFRTPWMRTTLKLYQDSHPDHARGKIRCRTWG